MKKIIAIIFAAVLLFNTVIFADEAAYNGQGDILAVFSANTEFNDENVTITLSELSRESNLIFSFNQATGLLHIDDANYRIIIKEMDRNIEVNEKALVLSNSGRIDIARPYSFKAYVNICRREGMVDSHKSVLEPQLFFSGKDSVSLLAEVTLEVTDAKAQFVVRNLGTSIETVDKGNISKSLENNLLLVNKKNTLDRNYFPSSMIYSKPSRGRSAVNLRLDKIAMQQLNFMLDAAYNDGVSGMVITSAFRTFDKQTSLFNNKTSLLSRRMNRKAAMEEASKVVALPGSSEHQTGLAADICSEGTGLISNFGNTKQGKWLADNSWKFGFIIRYPKDKTGITGIIYEPWHVRYVGSVHSEFMKVNNLCLEEYVEYLKTNSIISFTDSSGSNYGVQYINKQDFDAAGLTLSLPESSTWSISNCTKESYILTIKL